MFEFIKKWFSTEPQVSKQTLQRAVVAGQAINEFERTKITTQIKCAHLKGGLVRRNGSGGIFVDDSATTDQYAVIKHKMANGDIWVRCIRCGKTWKPPLRKDYHSDVEFYLAVKEYGDAVKFPTRNTMSSSIQFRFPSNEAVRNALANS